MTPALTLEGVSKRFGDFDAVKDLGFSVGAGRITGFLGPNGAGKTTTLRMVLGLIEPDSGSIRVLGEADVKRARDRIGFLPEERGLYRRMTPISAIVFLAGLKGMAAGAARRKAIQLLEENGLGEASRRQIRQTGPIYFDIVLPYWQMAYRLSRMAANVPSAAAGDTRFAICDAL